MGTGFSGARDTAFNMSWNVTSEMSPDRELNDCNTLKTLRTRSKQLIKDNPIVAGVQQTFMNLIGTPTAVYSSSDNRIQRKQVNDLLEEKLDAVDISGLSSIHNIVEELISSSFADGDVCVNLPLDDKGNTYVELIEAYRIDTPTNEKNKELVAHGVKYDEKGKLEGFFIKRLERIRNYNASLTKDFKYYPAVKESDGFSRLVTRLFKAPLNSRPSVSRQYPVITPCIVFFKLLDDYLEAVITGARVAACFSAFVVSKNPQGALKGFTVDTDGTVLDPQDANQERRVHKVQPASIFYLKPGEEIQFAAPNRPGDNADPFILRLYKTIAMYLRIPYPILFLDLVETNYSSWRGGANEVKKMVSRWRREISKIIKWVIDTYLLEALVNGRIRGNIKDARIKIRWPSIGILDPEKEARANKYRLENGTVSVPMACDEEGLSYEDIQKERQEHELLQLEYEAERLVKKKELEEKYGIEFPEDVEKDKSGDSDADRNDDGKVDSDEKKDKRKDDGNW